MGGWSDGAEGEVRESVTRGPIWNRIVSSLRGSGVVEVCLLEPI